MYEQYLLALLEWETGGEKSATGTNWESVRSDLQGSWNSSSWYYQDGSTWKKSSKSYDPKTHKRAKYENKWYYFATTAELDLWVDDKKAKDTIVIKPKTGTPPAAPTKLVNDALNDYGGFIDLDPNLSSGNTKDDQNTALSNFLGSTNAKGGADLPEAAGACLNEAIRSNWYDIKSAESKEYFKVPAGDVIVSEKDDVPKVSYTRVTNVPVVVFWSDAAINSLQKSRDYISASTPVSYSTFEQLWDGTIPSGDPESSKGVAANNSGRPVIDNRYRMMIHFGPENISGFKTLYDWDKVYYGGSLSTGNSQAVKVIAKKILETIPDLLRVGS
ncbi:MAG: hypothetical protein WBD01_08915 [Salaquimonas sp.]